MWWQGWVSWQCWLTESICQPVELFYPSIHSSSFYQYHPFSIEPYHQCYPALMVVGCWSPSQLCRGEAEVTPWASRQPIAGPHGETNKRSHSHTQTVQRSPFEQVQISKGKAWFGRTVAIKTLSFVRESQLTNVQRIAKGEFQFDAYSLMLCPRKLFQDAYSFPRQ